MMRQYHILSRVAFFSVVLCFFTVHESVAKERRPKKPWAFLFFIAGDEPEIDPWSRVPLKKLEQVGTSDEKWIVAHADFYWDRTGKTVSFEPSRRYLIEKNPSTFDGDDFSTLQILSPEVWQSSGESNSSAGKSLRDFLMWAREEFPAEHYAVFILGHSWGWRGIAQDYHPGYPLPESPATASVDFTMASLNEFREALRLPLSPQEKWDLLVMDACNDGVLEVAYEVRELARVFVAAPTEMPFLSFDYAKTLARPWRGVETFAKNLVEDSIVSFGRGGSQVKAEKEYPALALVAVSLEKMEPVWSQWKRVTQHLAGTNFETLFLGNESLGWMDSSWNIDFTELTQTLAKKSDHPKVRKAALPLWERLKVAEAPDESYRIFRAKGVRSVVVQMRADEWVTPQKALEKAKAQFNYLNPHLMGLHQEWKYKKKRQTPENGGREKWSAWVDVNFPWYQDEVSLRPFIAGGTSANVVLRDNQGKEVKSFSLSHPSGIYFYEADEGDGKSDQNPYLAVAHTFGAGRIKGLTLNLDNVLDESLPANHYFDTETKQWISGKGFYQSVSFAKYFGWAELLFGGPARTVERRFFLGRNWRK